MCLAPCIAPNVLLLHLLLQGLQLHPRVWAAARVNLLQRPHLLRAVAHSALAAGVAGGAEATGRRAGRAVQPATRLGCPAHQCPCHPRLRWHPAAPLRLTLSPPPSLPPSPLPLLAPPSPIRQRMPHRLGPAPFAVHVTHVFAGGGGQAAPPARGAPLAGGLCLCLCHGLPTAPGRWAWLETWEVTAQSQLQ